MPDDPDSTVTDPGDTPSPQVSDDSQGKTYTEAEFNAHMAGLRRSMEADKAKLAARLTELEAKSAKARPAKPNGKTSTTDEWAPTLTDYRAMDRAITKLGLSLNERQQTYMEAQLKAANPQDIGEWAKSELEAMGWAKPELKQDTVESPSDPPAGAKSDQGPPAAATSWEDKRSPLEWSPEDVDRILAEKGVHKGRRYIRERMEAYLKNVTVIPPPRG